MFEDAEMNDDAPVGDWFSRTGKSQFKVNWRMAREYEKFWLWTPTGEENLGDEEGDGRSAEKMWQSLRYKNCGLAELKECRLYTDRREISLERIACTESHGDPETHSIRK
jgi:hypothetical protein